MAYKRMPEKDPEAVLDYAFDWTDWLEVGETIDSYVTTPSSDLTVDSETESSGIVTVFISGGTNRANGTATCHIVTSAGREDDRTILIPVRQR